MKLKDYLDEKKGISILSTADKDGKLTTAIYSKPLVMEDNTIAFIMRERLTYHNLRNNPHAAYMFIENDSGYQGIRLFLLPNINSWFSCTVELQFLETLQKSLLLR